jgi:MFS family permease
LARRLLPVYFVAASVFSAGAARNFLVPLYAHDVGANRTQIGLLFAVFMAAAAVLSLPSGFLADHFGRKRALLFAIVAQGATQLGAGLTHSVPLLYLLQVGGGLGAAFMQTSLMAAVADGAPTGRMGQAMGWLTLAFQAGFLAGPAIAGVALEFTNYQGDLVLMTVLYGLALPAALFGVRAGPLRPRGRPLEIRSTLSQLQRQRGFYAVLLGLFASTVLWGTLQAFLPIFAKEQLGLPGAQIGYLLAIQAVANGLTRLPSGWLVDRLTRRGPLVIAGTSGYAVAVAVLPHVYGFWPATLVLALGVPLLATAFVALNVAFVDLATEETRGVTMGLNGLMLYLGLTAGPAVFGPVMQSAGYTAGFSACSVAVVVMMALVALLRSEPVERRRRMVEVLPPAAPGT